jgi:AraC-like DNA-binding protein
LLALTRPTRSVPTLAISRLYVRAPRCNGGLLKSIIDDVRKTLAIEYLERTSLSFKHICERVGFSDASNFRKAFKK